MSASKESKDVVINLKDGDKVSGKLISIDKVNLKIALIQVTKSFKDITKPNETYDNLEISKEDILEIKLVKYEQIQKIKEIKEEVSNINAIPENKIPEKVDQPKQNTYDKSESFFDNLKLESKTNTRQDIKNYNDKNKDTFDLKDNYHNFNNIPHKKGFTHNYNYSHRGQAKRGNFNYNNYNHHQQGNYRNNYQYNHTRGRGGFSYYVNRNKNYHHFDNKTHLSQEQGQNEVEKSIYDN